MNISRRVEVCSCLATETLLFDLSPYVASEPCCHFRTLSFPVFFFLLLFLFLLPLRMYGVVHLVATVALTALQTVLLFLNRSIMIFEYMVHWVRCKKVIWSIRTITISCPRTPLLIGEHLLVWTATSLISTLSLYWITKIFSRNI